MGLYNYEVAHDLGLDPTLILFFNKILRNLSTNLTLVDVTTQ